MKLVIDEKLKHRLIGLAVIISIAAIFAPAVMKKSGQHAEKYTVNVQLPSKPIAPGVVMTDEKEVFKTIKIAKVDLEPVSQDRQLNEIVKAKPVKSDLVSSVTATAAADLNEKTKLINLAVNDAAKKTIKLKNLEPLKHPEAIVAKAKTKAKARIIQAKVIASTKIAKAVKATRVAAARKLPARVATVPRTKRDIYAVQLASFSQLTNAQTLVSRLHGKGYQAKYAKVPTKNGAVYKVYVGHSPHKPEVVKLKTLLANAMQLNGFVVNTGVS